MKKSRIYPLIFVFFSGILVGGLFVGSYLLSLEEGRIALHDFGDSFVVESCIEHECKVVVYVYFEWVVLGRSKMKQGGFEAFVLSHFGQTEGMRGMNIQDYNISSVTLKLSSNNRLFVLTIPKHTFIITVNGTEQIDLSDRLILPDGHLTQEQVNWYWTWLELI